MQDIAELIHAAWLRVQDRLQIDQHELARRLTRRGRPTLVRPPRAWCVAIRASDHRLNRFAFHVQRGESEAPRSIFDPPPQEVRLTGADLQRLCQPVHLSREYLEEAAEKLGTSESGLTPARIRGKITAFHVPLMGGRPGGPIPLLSSGDGGLDPQAHLFAQADKAWAWTAFTITARIPKDLRVTLRREMFFRGHVSKHLYDENRHPEIDSVPPPRKRLRLPAPEEDPCCWYKWSRADHFLGNDPSNWRKHPDDLGLRPRRDLPKSTYQRKRPALSQSKGSDHFNGYFWRCPVCQKRCRKVYYPLPPINLLQQKVPKIAKLVEIPRKIGGFACLQCHGVRHFTTLGGDAWNQLIAYLTQGLLYGREVAKPEWWTARRQREYRPRPTPAPRREQVRRRLLNGWTLEQIATDMKIRKKMVYQHMLAICRQEGVANRHELAAKLGSRHEQPMNMWDRARRRRAEVEKLILSGLTNAEIAARLGISRRMVADHAWKVFRGHGVVGRAGLHRKLAEERLPTL